MALSLIPMALLFFGYGQFRNYEDSRTKKTVAVRQAAQQQQQIEAHCLERQDKTTPCRFLADRRSAMEKRTQTESIKKQ